MRSSRGSHSLRREMQNGPAYGSLSKLLISQACTPDFNAQNPYANLEVCWCIFCNTCASKEKTGRSLDSLERSLTYMSTANETLKLCFKNEVKSCLRSSP